MTARPRKNPFRPGVGTRPLHLAGRADEIRRFGAALRSAPEIPANVRLTGLRGVGKTVLLSEFERVAAEVGGWATAILEVEPRHNTEPALVAALGRACERTRASLSRLADLRRRVGRAREKVRIEVSFENVAVTFDASAGDAERDLAKDLYQTAMAAYREGNEGFAVLLDEAQILRDERSRDGEHPLSLLIAAVSALQKKEVPLALVLCGLPTLTGNLLKARTCTERMFRGEEIGSLSADASREAFVEPLQSADMDADPALVDAVLAAVEGYPYFIQLWGAELWDAAASLELDRLTAELLDAVEPHIYRRLDLDFYDPRVQTLTPAEQDLLLLGASCPYPPLKVADINQVTDKRPGNVNVLLGRLVDAGVLFRLRKGQYEYTAPKFYEYLQRRRDRA